MPAAPTRHCTALLLLAAALAGAVALVGPGAAGAQAAPQVPASDRSHDPFGMVTTVTAVPGGIQWTGWAADPDALTSHLNYVTLLDGLRMSDGPVTPYPNLTVEQKYKTGPTPSFKIVEKVPAGNHTACLAARDIGPGMLKVLRCVALPLGRWLSPTALAAHDPVGQLGGVWAGNGQFRLQGWTDDPDFLSRYSVVVLYIDGAPAATRYTTYNPASRIGGPGYNSAFDITVPVSSGTHVGCLWAVNVGFGANSLIGCRTRDTRGPAGTGPLPAPALNKEVVAEAVKHIGQPYVWGATGPAHFDCSGLVAYSYGKFGYTTPRVAADQFRAARGIPPGRAVPGDLVFYHDSVGDVYHVGIYISPGKTVAAIDTQEGVNWQYIWNPTNATYGSFTHV